MLSTREQISETKIWVISDFLVGITIVLIGASFLYRKYWDKKRKEKLISNVVVITGASSGLGEALAHVFYRAGCKVVLAARRETELLRVQNDLLAVKLETPTYSPTIVKLDLQDLDSIPEIVNKILKKHNHIDILINNGGISFRGDVLSTSIDVDVKIMLTNYFGSVALTKAMLPLMIQQKKGKIVFISSVQGKFALPFRSAYSASKHAMQAFCDSLRAEVSKNNVNIICISPGYIRTSLSKNALNADGTKHGKMDSATAKGISPKSMANNVLLSIIRNEKDNIFAQQSAKFAYWLRILCPSMYFWVMSRRAIKQLEKED